MSDKLECKGVSTDILIINFRIGAVRKTAERI